MQIYECFLTRKCMTTERGDCSIKAKSIVISNAQYWLNIGVQEIGRNQQQFQLPHLTRRNRWTYRGPNRGMGLSSGFTIQKVEKWWKLFKRLGLDTLHIPQHVLLWGIKKQYIYFFFLKQYSDSGVPTNIETEEHRNFINKAHWGPSRSDHSHI